MLCFGRRRIKPCNPFQDARERSVGISLQSMCHVSAKFFVGALRFNYSPGHHSHSASGPRPTTWSVGDKENNPKGSRCAVPRCWSQTTSPAWSAFT